MTDVYLIVVALVFDVCVGCVVCGIARVLLHVRVVMMCVVRWCIG